MRHPLNQLLQIHSLEETHLKKNVKPVRSSFCSLENTNRWLEVVFGSQGDMWVLKRITACNKFTRGSQKQKGETMNLTGSSPAEIVASENRIKITIAKSEHTCTIPYSRLM